MAKEELQNPADKYPKPPYKKQSQPWPGLASKMDPRPRPVRYANQLPQQLETLIVRLKSEKPLRIGLVRHPRRVCIRTLRLLRSA